jgi:hypothetical protein
MRYIEILERLVDLENRVKLVEASRKSRYLEYLKDLPYSKDHKEKVVRGCHGSL